MEANKSYVQDKTKLLNNKRYYWNEDSKKWLPENMLLGNEWYYWNEDLKEWKPESHKHELTK